METQPGTQQSVMEETETKTQKNFRVILLNDEDHTYDYVVEMLCFVCGMKKDQAFRCSVEVDLTGKTIVFYGSHKKCANISVNIKNYGPDHRLMQSMGGMDSEVDAL
jgi:ATP-dependent Clp protease adaptor protein ClpS